MEATSTAEYGAFVLETAAAARAALGLGTEGGPPASVETALILGSGLSTFVNEMVDMREVAYADLPHAPKPTVKGHSGKLCVGRIVGENGASTWIIGVAGRSHQYEGLHMFQLNFMVRVLRALGCVRMIASNAAGGFLQGMFMGCVMVIRDHINFYKRNPLHDTAAQPHQFVCPTLPNSEALYSRRLGDLAHEVAREMDFRMFEGVYAAMSGPSYETHSEVREFGALGVGSFGMSTVNEVLVAASLGMEVFAASLITNLAAGLTDEVLTHGAVTDVASESGPLFVRFMKRMLLRIPATPGAPEFSPIQEVDAALVQNSSTLLPQKLVAPVTDAGLEPAVTQLREQLGLDADIHGFTCVSYSSSHSGPTNENAVPLATLQNWPGISPLPNQASISLDKENKKRVVIQNVPACGFWPEEATFLAELLKKLGCARLIVTLVAKATQDTAAVCQVEDIYDWTGLHTVSAARLRSIGGKAPASFTFAGTKLLNVLDSANLASTSYMHVMGPSNPTPAEQGLAEPLGCSTVGISSPSLIYAARAAGIAVGAVCEASANFSSSPYVLEGVTRAARTLADVQIAAESERTPSGDAGSTQLSYQLAHHDGPPSQASLDEIISSLPAAVTAAVKGGLVVVTNDAYASVLSNGDVHHESHGTFAWGKADGYVVFWTPFDLSFGSSYAQTMAPIHVAIQLGANAIVVVGGYASVTDDLQGSISVCKDHVNLNGRSPLSGHNNDAWGPRFPDVSNAHAKSLRSTFMTLVKQDMEFGTHAIIVGVQTGAHFASQANARAVRSLHLQGAVSGVASEILAAAHRSAPAMALCVREVALREGCEPIVISDDKRQEVLQHLRETLQKAASSLVQA